MIPYRTGDRKTQLEVRQALRKLQKRIEEGKVRNTQGSAPVMDLNPCVNVHLAILGGGTSMEGVSGGPLRGEITHPLQQDERLQRFFIHKKMINVKNADASVR